MLTSYTAVALGSAMVPFTLKVPGAETLMAGIVPCEVAVFDEPLIKVATCNKDNLFVEAHVDRMWFVNGDDSTIGVNELHAMSAFFLFAQQHRLRCTRLLVSPIMSDSMRWFVRSFTVPDRFTGSME
jgi:hypothetical protein